MEKKLCTKCLVEKDITDFGVYSKKTGKLRAECKPCNVLRAVSYYAANKQRTYETKLKRINKNREAYLQKRKEHYLANIVKAQEYVDRNKSAFLYRGAKKRAKEKNIQFNLSEFPNIPALCPIFLCPFNLSARNKPDLFSPTLDRIDSSHGYIDNNVRVISHRANIIKNDASKQEIKSLIDWIKQPKSVEILNNDIVKRKVIRMLTDAKYRANRKKIPFSITVEDIMKIASETCPVFDIPIAWSNKAKRCEASPSIERIDSNKGYELGNVAIISWRANRIKKDATLSELEAIYERGFI
jgi:hypothetical protein